MGGHRSWMRAGMPFGQAINRDVTGPEWEVTYYKYVEMHKSVNPRNQESTRRHGRALRNAPEKGVGYCDPGSERKIESRALVR